MNNRSFDSSIENFTSNGVAVPTSLVSFGKINQSKSISEVNLNASFPLQDSFYLGLSYEIGLGKKAITPPSYTDHFNNETGTLADTMTVKNHRTFIVAPGYKISDKTLVSLRLGTVKYRIEAAAVGEPTDVFKNSNGVLGVGVDQALTDNLMLGITYDTYRAKSSSIGGVDSDGDAYTFQMRSKGSSFRIGLKYKF
jgi:opacity protein-like surface antigen